MAVISSLTVRIGADLKPLESGLKEAQSQLTGFGPKLSGVGAKFSSGLKEAERRLVAFGPKLSSVGVALSAGLTAPLVGLGVASVRAATEMDSLKRGLTAVAGSSEEAERQLVRLKEVAKLPGLGRTEAIQMSTQLQAAGLSANLAERSLMAFGNALATVGKGKAELGGVALALSQIQSKGKVSAEEINQLAERIPQIRVAMREAFGTADTQALQKQGIGAQQFIEGIVTQLGKLPKATGGVQNAFENLQDTIGEALGAIGKNILPTLLPIVERLAAGLTGLTQQFAAMPQPVRGVVLGVAAAAAALGPLALGIGQIITLLPALKAGFLALTGPVGLAIAGVTAVVAGLVYAWRNNLGGIRDETQKFLAWFVPRFMAGWEQVKAGVIAVWAVIGPHVKKAAENLARLIVAVMRAIRGDWSGAWEQVKAIARSAWDTIVALFAGIGRVAAEWGRSLWQGLVSGIKSGVGAIGEAARGLATRALGSIKETLGIESPSKEMIAVGRQMVEGLVVGIGQDQASVREGEKLVQKMLAGMEKEAKKAADIGRQIRERLAGAVQGARVEALREQARVIYGELSRPFVALDVLNKQWQNLTAEEQKAVERVLEYRRQTEAAKQSVEALDSARRLQAHEIVSEWEEEWSAQKAAAQAAKQAWDAARGAMRAFRRTDPADTEDGTTGSVLPPERVITARERLLQDLAAGTEHAFSHAFSQIDRGFTGLFQGLADSFRQVLVRMASDFLASQLSRLLLRSVGGAVGGGNSTLPAIAGSFGNLALGTVGGGGGGLTMPSAGLGYQGGLEKAIAGSFGNLELSTGAAVQAAQRGGAPVNVVMHVHGVTDAASIRRNEGQIAASVGMATQRAVRRNRGVP